MSVIHLRWYVKTFDEPFSDWPTNIANVLYSA
jgi:hypothetical protein